MKIVQLSKNNSSLPEGWLNTHKIIHIGVEHLHSIPITEVSNINNMFNIEINDEEYYVNACDILEYDDLNYNFITQPPTIDTSNWDDFTFLTIGYNETTT